MTKAFNMDCMQAMAQMPDNAFDLAIVDPPYGIGEDGLKNHSRGSKGILSTKYTPKDWDKKPADKYYFYELIRISRHQIIWGANHFISRLPYDSSCWIVWNKDNTGDFADCELAYTNFKTAVRMFTYPWNGMLQGDMRNKEKRIHPTQKPVKLYEWLLKNYAKPGYRIIDTHLGSGSSRIAADKMGYYFEGYEIDKEYFDAQEKRFNEYKSQLKLF